MNNHGRKAATAGLQQVRPCRGRSRTSILATTVLAALAAVSAVHADESFPQQFRAFLRHHCATCHSGDAPEGGLNVETFSTNLADAEVRRRWVLLHDRVAAGEMPPKSDDQPPAAEKSKFLRSLAAQLTRADLATREVVLRRLNRNEYENTVRDLFGIHIDLHNVLPDDTPEQGFDTIGSGLSLSTEQMLLYIEAADLVLDEVFGPPTPPRRIDNTWNFTELRSRTTADRIVKDGVILFSGAKSLPMYGASVRDPGLYRLRLQVKAVQSEQPVVMRVDGGVTGRIPSHVAGFFEVPPGELTTIEFTDRAVESSDTFAFALVGGFPWWSVNADDYAGAGLFIGDVTIEGPLEEWPRESRTKLMATSTRSDSSGKPAEAEPLQTIHASLRQVLPRAFRRPTSEKQLQPWLALARQALDDGQSLEQALRRALKGILCAPEFLYLEEPLASNDPAHIDDHALAARLSFFLWSSLPDAELHDLATRGELHKPDVLHTQVERMLQDGKSQRFVRNFTDQWLKLRDIDFTVPNDRLYPEYNQLLRQSMLEESRGFFRENLEHDHSVQNFLDSDFAMLNRPLAEFYGIPGVKGLAVHRVELPDDSLRGGVLTQAAVLKVSADGTRTSPVLRGAWILKNLYGAPPQPPPPSVTAIEPDIRGALTIREQLKKHRSHESCNRCHSRIDPPGFALESFDVIGGQRDWYRTAQGGSYVKKPLHPQAPRHSVRYRHGPDVDASGTLPDGRRFSGIREYRKLLLEDETAMPNALARLLMTYSLGRHLGFSDRPETDRIVATAGKKNYGLRTLIHEVTQSPTFRKP